MISSPENGCRRDRAQRCLQGTFGTSEADVHPERGPSPCTYYRLQTQGCSLDFGAEGKTHCGLAGLWNPVIVNILVTTLGIPGAEYMGLDAGCHTPQRVWARLGGLQWGCR